MHLPPHLKSGDSIAITCPSGYMHPDTVQNAVNTFENWGLNVITGATLSYPSDNYFSAPDSMKINELQAYLDDPDIKAIFMGRGGYGMSRIIDKLDFSAMRQTPKWVCGFSDITLLHLHLQSIGIVSLHSPMCSTFNLDDDHVRSYNIAYITDSLLSDCALQYEWKGFDEFQHSGCCTGRIIGGNLAMLSHAVGSSSFPDTHGAILFIEDIGEHIYKIDRMLYQLKRSGKLDHLAGVLVGQFSDIEDTTRPYGKRWEEVIWMHFKELGIPVAFNFPAGHEDKNAALKLGEMHTLDTRYTIVKLETA